MNQTASLLWQSTLKDLLVLDRVETLRALAHEERLRMVALLGERPHTATTLARQLGIEPNRAHYHLQRLVAAGLVRCAGIGRRRWKEERFFVAVARHLLVDPGLACGDAETAAAIMRGIESNILDWRRREVLDIDSGQIARIVVRDCLRVGAGERLLVLFAPAGLELAECVLVELEAAGALGRLKPWSRNSLLRTLDRHDEASLARLPFVHPDDDSGLNAAVYIGQMMPQGAPPGPEQRAKLPSRVEALSRWQRSLRERGVRFLEIGLPWRGEFVLGDVAPEDALDSYWRCLVTDYDELTRRARSLLGRMAGESTLRIRTRGDNELRVNVDAARPLVSDGVLDEEDVRSGRSAESIPAGALRFLPGGAGAEGSLRADYLFLGGRHVRDVCVTLRRGRIAHLAAPEGAEAVRARIAQETGEPDRLAMVSIGLNPAGVGRTGKVSLDACLEGTVTVSFGNNELWGGGVRSSLDLELPAFGASLAAGEIELVSGGRLVHERSTDSTFEEVDR